MRAAFFPVVALVCLIGGTLTVSAAVTRGPYLQLATTSNIVVRWRTDVPTDSVVRFGRAPDALGWSVSDSASVTEHVVQLTNLLADTDYFYAVGTSSSNLIAGADYRFHTAWRGAKSLRFWVVGDSGTAEQPGYEGLAAQVRDAFLAFNGSRRLDGWLMVGDNAYLHGWDEEYQTELFDVYPMLLRQSVLWPAIGNHDVTGTPPMPYFDSFTLPTAGEAGGAASGTENYYSWDYGNVHFVVLDSEMSEISDPAPMVNWLRSDLAAANATWLIAYWHQPPYTRGSHNSDTTWGGDVRMSQMRQYVVPVLEQHGVDLVLGGHSHSYERSMLLDGHYGFSSSFTPPMALDSGSGREGDSGAYLKATASLAPHEGTVYAVVGSSGWITPYGSLDHPTTHTAFFELGSLVLDINTNRLDATFLRENGVVADRFTILKGAAAEPLRIVTLARRNGMVHLQWKSRAGHSYIVKAAEALTPESWSAVGTIVTATGATTGWSNSVPVTAAKFFRVVELTP